MAALHEICQAIRSYRNGPNVCHESQRDRNARARGRFAAANPGCIAGLHLFPGFACDLSTHTQGFLFGYGGVGVGVGVGHGSAVA